MRGKRNTEQPQLGQLLPPCRVCGQKGAGFHYGVTTCEACKGFFRRSLVRRKPYECIASHQCYIGASTARRQSCPKCRYDKCLAVGMSKSAIKTGRYSLMKKSRDISELLQYHNNAAENNMDDNLQKKVKETLEKIRKARLRIKAKSPIENQQHSTSCGPIQPAVDPWAVSRKDNAIKGNANVPLSGKVHYYSNDNYNSSPSPDFDSFHQSTDSYPSDLNPDNSKPRNTTPFNNGAQLFIPYTPQAQFTHPPEESSAVPNGDIFNYHQNALANRPTLNCMNSFHNNPASAFSRPCQQEQVPNFFGEMAHHPEVYSNEKSMTSPNGSPSSISTTFSDWSDSPPLHTKAYAEIDSHRMSDRNHVANRSLQPSTFYPPAPYSTYFYDTSKFSSRSPSYSYPNDPHGFHPSQRNDLSFTCMRGHDSSPLPVPSHEDNGALFPYKSRSASPITQTAEPCYESKLSPRALESHHWSSQRDYGLMTPPCQYPVIKSELTTNKEMTFERLIAQSIVGSDGEWGGNA